MAGRCEQPAIVVLAVDLHQMRGDLAQQRGGSGLVVDEPAAAAIGLDEASHDQRFARFDLEPVLRQHRREAAGGWVEGRGDRRLYRGMAYEPAIAARAQRQPQRVEQDRLARAGFTGQHAEPVMEIEIERLDQHHVADG